MIVLEIEGDDGATGADNPDSDTHKNCSDVCNDIPLNSSKMLERMNYGHVLINCDDKNMKNH